MILGSPEAWGQNGLVLVKNSSNPLPIIVQPDAPFMTTKAADELASYIERTSGARPQVHQGTPSPMPDNAIWVGYQPALDKLFPDIDFNFAHPEEILLASNENHVVIAGRDKWDPAKPNGVTRHGKELEGYQLEYGTANAIYTFLQDHIGVRWFWPGPGGIDVLDRKTITIPAFTYRYHPKIRQRSTLLRFAARRWGGDARVSNWTRVQRLDLDSMLAPIQSHGFDTWWKRFGASRPELFALQPDGSRSGFPGGTRAKICESNPEVWDQWLKDVEAQLVKNPDQTIFSGSANDSYHRGHCVCDNCRAWDHPDAEKFNFAWEGSAQLYPALSDRYVTFANKLGQKLKERFPDRPYQVVIFSYGYSRPAPLAARPDDNVIICGVHNFHLREDDPRNEGMQQMADWGKVSPVQFWRPNLGSGTLGSRWGMPDISMKQAIHDFRFAADNGVIGVNFDSIWLHWSTQGPHYYMMAQMVWNPYQDGEAVLEDYYQRAFGPAYDEMKEYWTTLENIRDHVAADSALNIALDMPQIFTPQVMDNLQSLLDAAQRKVASSPQGFIDRVAFVRAGFEYTKLVVAARTMMVEYENTGLKDKALADRINELWKQADPLKEAHPQILFWQRLTRVGLHPKSPASEIRGAYRLAKAFTGNNKTISVKAEDTGWRLVHEDRFNRQELGDHWLPVTGQWRIDNGKLLGSGTLVSAIGFPQGDAIGYLRMEFQAQAISNPASNGQASNAFCDLSSLLHAADPQTSGARDPIQTGYFFQFGGFHNTQNMVRRAGRPIQQDRSPSILIAPGKTHHIIVESDQGRVRMIVDSKLVLDQPESSSILGPANNRVGFYSETSMKIDNVKIYTKQLEGGLDLE